MKRILSVLIVILMLISCETEPKGYRISAEIDGVVDGRKVSLLALVDGKFSTIDSTELNKGKFMLQGNVKEMGIHVISVQGVSGRLPIILENKSYDVLMYKDSLQLSKVEGSKENNVAQKYMKALALFRKKHDALTTQLKQARQTNDTIFFKLYNEKRQEIINEKNEFDRSFISNNNNSFYSLLVLNNLLDLKVVEISDAIEIYEGFPNELQNTSVGLKLKKRINAIIATKVGALAPDFTATNPEGEEITLSKIKGKVTIIDFWAAWCGPCRKENPNLVKVYNKYHEKGLEIIGVSLDGSSRQKNSRNDWLNAIEKDGLGWYQVSNLNYFNGPVAKKYNIRAIPAMFILDSEGKIIAKNLRGSALEQKISELLD